MGNVMVIPARRQVGNTVKQSDQKKLRVAAYCRVSTDSEEQETSYEAQVTHYTEYIQKNPEWELAGIFADDGISGTNTKKRDEFNRMIDECMAGNIDMVITKSISRFARNTLDCLQYIRQLKDKNISVYFEKEAINTLDAKGEVLITIMASLAQQESQSMSQNIKLGLQYRYQQGKVQVNHNRFLGYTKDDNGHLIIDPEQAEIVKRIYREYLEGSSMDKIADGLMADGILTGAGKTKWHTSTINKILRNEKYMGDALLQKTYTTDFLTKKRIKNNGTVPQYYVEGDHEAIIAKELFMQVQAELIRRRVVHVSPTGKKRSFSCNHCFAQMVFCGDCGELYRRVHWNNHGCKSIVWRCISRLEPTSAEMDCTNRTVNELLLQEVTVKAFHQILTERDFFLKTLQQNIAKAVVNADTLSPDGIQARLEELQKELIKKANNKQDYDAIADEIFRLRDQKEQSELDSHHREEAMNRIKELQDFISGQETDITEFDEALVKTHRENHRLQRPLHRGIQVRHYNRHRIIKRASIADLLSEMLVCFTSNMLKVLFQLFDLEKSEYRFSSGGYVQMALQKRYRKPSLNTSILCPYRSDHRPRQKQYRNRLLELLFHMGNATAPIPQINLILIGCQYPIVFPGDNEPDPRKDFFPIPIKTRKS